MKKLPHHDMTWKSLLAFAKENGINVKHKKKADIIKELDEHYAVPDEVKVDIKNLENMEEVKAPTVKFEGIKDLPKKKKEKKESHPIFNDIKEVMPSLKAYKKLQSISSHANINQRVAEIFLEHIETQKNAPLNLSCGVCKPRYYNRLIQGYNILAEEHGKPTI